MANTSTQTGLAPLRQADIQDPLLTVLNGQISFLHSSVSVLSTTDSSEWTPYTPTISASGGMTTAVTNYFRDNYIYLDQDIQADILLDVGLELGGTASNTIYVTLPKVPSGSGRVAMACAGSYGTGTFACQAVVTKGQLAINRYDNSNFTLGPCELIISGFYAIG